MRVRVRTLLIAVALVALVLGAAVGFYAERRRSYYRLRVESLAWGEADVVDRIAECLQAAREAQERGPAGLKEAESARAEAEWLAKLASWHVKLERSYMRAVERPWESLPPDPAPPRPPPGLDPKALSQGLRLPVPVDR